MKDKIKENLHKLSSKSVSERKKAIKTLARLIHHKDAYIARLSLRYVSAHDPSYTVRNLARQACCDSNKEISDHSWERAYLFY